jgi:branched-chain amino acid transport system ATP-binding protein
MSSQHNISVQGVVMDFAGLRALDHVSLSLERGVILGLIGPNGSGKTTLVNIITGFLKPSAGSVQVDGQDVTGWSPYQIAQVSIRRTFQTIRLFKKLTVLENVMAAAVSSGMNQRQARDESRKALERLGILRFAAIQAGTLAYGAERRVEVARALVTKPAYLLLDEPAAGMNENESDELLEMIPAIVRDYGCGLLIIDHDMRLIMRLCQRLHVLNYGKTIAEGTPAEIRRNQDVIAAYLGGSV